RGRPGTVRPLAASRLPTAARDRSRHPTRARPDAPEVLAAAFELWPRRISPAAGARGSGTQRAQAGAAVVLYGSDPVSDHPRRAAEAASVGPDVLVAGRQRPRIRAGSEADDALTADRAVTR